MKFTIVKAASAVTEERCDGCGGTLWADVYIGPSGNFYCTACWDKARQSSPRPVERTGEE